MNFRQIFLICIAGLGAFRVLIDLRTRGIYNWIIELFLLSIILMAIIEMIADLRNFIKNVNDKE